MNISPPTDIEKILPIEIAYADNVEFISIESKKRKQFSNITNFS